MPWCVYRITYTGICFQKSWKTVNKEEYETNKFNFPEKYAIVTFCKEELGGKKINEKIILNFLSQLLYSLDMFFLEEFIY